MMHRIADADTDTDLAPDLPVLFITHMWHYRLMLPRRLPGYAVIDNLSLTSDSLSACCEGYTDYSAVFFCAGGITADLYPVQVTVIGLKTTGDRGLARSLETSKFTFS